MMGRSVSKERLVAERIIDNDVVNELEKSFLEYSMSVIMSRALPDVRDGLKPVQRRILYGLYRQGMRPGSPYKKCARVVGDIMGKYHPHGDSAIYEALVRMGSEEILRLPLIDPHGNFGSLDNPPAASRYTECRLAPSAMAIIDELDEDTVDLVPNYDGEEREPVVLPAGIPYLLINGASGIAVGLATYMVPHNFGEVAAGMRAMLDNPKITLDELMSHILGPDFPTGGIVFGASTLKELYETGRGRIRIRGKVHREQDGRRTSLVITELPYMVGPETIIGEIRKQIGLKRINGISDANDLTALGTGTRLVVTVKSTANVESVLAELYRYTSLDTTLTIQNVVLVNGAPKTLGLWDLCRHYLDHRLEVVRRRSAHRLVVAEARKHIVDGYILAYAHIDQIVACIKSSKDADTARRRLSLEFGLTELQASAILEMTLRRLTSLEVSRYQKELSDLKKNITYLSKLLKSEKLLLGVVGEELAAAASAFSTPRRTLLVKEIPIDTAVLVEETPQASTYSEQYWGVVDGKLTTHVIKKGALSEIPLTLGAYGIKADGSIVVAKEGERGILAVLPLTADGIVYMLTNNGVVKAVEMRLINAKLKRPIITLPEGRRVVGAFWGTAESICVAVSSKGQVSRFSGSNVRPQGLSGGGVAGVRIGLGEEIVAFGDGSAGKILTLLSDLGRVKSTPMEEYPIRGRGGVGVRGYAFRKGEEKIVSAIFSGDQIALDIAGKLVKHASVLCKRDGSGVALKEGSVAKLGYYVSGS
jgi:DNA gyrase subunit A